MKKAKKTTSKKESNLYAYYIELDSPLDFARHNSSHSPGHIKAIKENGKYRLLSTGEKLGDIRIVYYSNIDKIGKFFIYKRTADSNEKFEIKDNIMNEQTDFKSYKAPIIELLSNPYIESKDFKKSGKIIKVEIKDFDTFIKSIVGNMHEEESSPKLYAFFKGDSHIIGTFDLFHESNARIFAYAKTSIKEKFGTLSYNYMNDTIEPVISFDGKSEVYIRVINLKKEFPFF